MSRVSQPLPRPDGQLVTVRNCRANECRWPYGDEHADMVLCGRPIAKRSYCADHVRMAKAKPPGGASHDSQA